MRAIRLKDNFYFELSDEVYDKDGNDYLWKDLLLIPDESESVNYRPSQAETEKLRQEYAGIAMQGILLASDKSVLDHKGEVVKHAIEFADELIKQLTNK